MVLVLKNLLENGFINQDKYKELINSKIKLNKRKRIYLEDSRYYVEDVRKEVINKYGFDKVYKQGFNIKTPIDLNLQNIATNALRHGLESYDKRRGWRGALVNKKINNEWKKGLEKFNLEKSIGWEIAIVKRIDKFETVIETQANKIGIINNEDINWTRKNLNQIFKIGDIIYVKKKK